MKLEMLLVSSYLITLAAEVLFALCWKICGRDLAIVVLANTMTNPPVVLLNFLFRLVVRGTVAGFLLAVMEIAAFAVEGFVYKRAWQKGERPYLFSLCANLCSFLCGIAFSAIRHSIIG